MISPRSRLPPCDSCRRHTILWVQQEAFEGDHATTMGESGGVASLCRLLDEDSRDKISKTSKTRDGNKKSFRRLVEELMLASGRALLGL